MTVQLPASDLFIEQIMAAIVKQFFENPQVVVTDGSGYIPPRTNPVQLVAARMLAEKNSELLTSILEQIDLDALAGDVADLVHAMLIKPDSNNTYHHDPDDNRRKLLKERVDNRLVELLAQDLFVKMKSEESHDN